MKSIINNHYNNLTYINSKLCISFDLMRWYTDKYDYGILGSLSYSTSDFIKAVNTQLHINVKWRLERGLPVYGKET